MELSCGFFGTSFSLSSLFTESICNPVDKSFGSSVVVVSVSCVEDSPMIGKQFTVAKYWKTMKIIVKLLKLFGHDIWIEITIKINDGKSWEIWMRSTNTNLLIEYE